MNETTKNTAVATAPAAPARPEPGQGNRACTCSTLKRADGKGTGCDRTVPRGRAWAPGHDAKAKSFLVQAALDGQAVTRDGNTTPADRVWDAVSDHGFGYQVYDLIKAKQAKKAAAAARLAAKQAAEQA